MIRDMMLEAVEARFGKLRAPRPASSDEPSHGPDRGNSNVVVITT
jgi:hypothetical protein